MLQIARLFKPLGRPGPHDWLSTHVEMGQTFDQFCLPGCAFAPTIERSKIYIVTIGPPSLFPVSMELLSHLISFFFFLKVQIIPYIPLERVPRRSRVNAASRKRQLDATSVLQFMQTNVPSDAFCTIAVTTEDIYLPGKAEYLFGAVATVGRVGLCSIARFDPRFYGHKRPKDFKATVFKRLSGLMLHETCHLFGLKHCIYFECLMNGSNCVKENDARPLHLCPVCMRKLYHCVGFEPIVRFQELRLFFGYIGFYAEAKWLDVCLRYLMSQPRSTTESQGGRMPPKNPVGDGTESESMGWETMSVTSTSDLDL